MSPMKKGTVLDLPTLTLLDWADIDFDQVGSPTELEAGKYVLLGDLPDSQATAPIRRFVVEDGAKPRWAGPEFKVALAWLDKYGFAPTGEHIDPDTIQ